jgi:hypothetical protein
LNSKVFLKVLVPNAIVLRHTIDKYIIDGQIKEKSNLNMGKKKTNNTRKNTQCSYITIESKSLKSYKCHQVQKEVDYK